MRLTPLIASAVALLVCGFASIAQAQENRLMASAPYFFFGGQGDGANEFIADYTCLVFNASAATVRVKIEARTFKARANRGDIADSAPKLRAFALGAKRVGILRNRVSTSTASSAQCQVIHDGPADSIVASMVVEDGADGRGAIAGPVEFVATTSRATR